MTCHACDEGRCADTFTCRVCGRVRNTCMELAGGLDAVGGECVHCQERRLFGPGWVKAWSGAGGLFRTNVCDKERIEAVVQEAIAYREAEEEAWSVLAR